MSKAILNYENIDDSLELEIFGLEFKIIFSESFQKKLEETQREIEKNAENMNSSEILEKLDVILGNGAVKKITEKYENDQEHEIGFDTWLTIYAFISNEIQDYFDKKSEKIKPRRNYNNNYQGIRRNNFRKNHYRR